MEQADAMRALWRDTPAFYHGKHVNFDGLYCLPPPVQLGGIPILFGLGVGERVWVDGPQQFPRFVERLASLKEQFT
jgi:alkanesulfonate monooxygenase SsuD/methylene tetrahydromethanopterin reductase-like flavin-dependent oxidoreductase (luciferase family)